MCVVSAVSDYYRPRHDFVPNYPPVQNWDWETKQLLREALQRLDKIDKRLGDIECHDESKAALLKELGL
jgi:hypothetical protein